MHKWKRAMILLTALGILVACAALPRIAAVCRDRDTFGQSHYGTVSNVQLQIREERETPVMAKLAMMSRMQGSLAISDSMAAMTREEAEAHAVSILQAYFDAGLIDAFVPKFYEVRCMLGQVPGDPSLSQIYWSADMVSASEENFAQVSVIFDDETGSLLAVDYTREEQYSKGERQMKLAFFAEFYFISLGITEYGNFEASDLETKYIGENVSAVRYRFGDAVYGEISVDLYAHEHGFYTEFPDL